MLNSYKKILRLCWIAALSMAWLGQNAFGQTVDLQNGLVAIILLMVMLMMRVEMVGMEYLHQIM
jgi:hypothetical protein